MSVAVEAPFVEVPLLSRGVVDLINRPAFVVDGQRFSRVSSVCGDEVFTADNPTRALTGDAVVALPMLGEFVRTHDGTQGVYGYWLGLVREVAQQGRLEAFVLEESRVRLVSFGLVQVEDRLGRLADAAHAEADERKWCSEFDDFLEAQGLPRRSRDYQLQVEVTATVYLSRRSEEHTSELQ